MNEIEKAKAQYKELSPKQKREHIWEYYRIHIIGTIIAVIMVTWLATDMWKNAHTVTLLDISYVGTSIDTEAMIALQTQLEEYYKEKGVEGIVVVEPLPLGENVDPNQVMASTAKLMGKAQTNDLDILITDEGYYKQYLESEMYQPLDDYANTGALTVNSDNFVEESGGIMAVDGTQYEAIQKLTYGEEKQRVSIYINSERKEAALEIINLLLGE